MRSLEPGGHSVTGNLPERGHTPGSLRLGEIVPSRPRSPFLCLLQDRALTSLPGTPEAGVSQADCLQETHTFICKGETEVKLGFLLAGDSGALAQVLGSVCVLARTGDSFLKCFSLSLCQSVHNSH